MNDTGTPTPAGECQSCGYMTYHGLYHPCSTAPKFSWPNPPRQYPKDNDDEISEEAIKRFYEMTLKGTI